MDPDTYTEKDLSGLKVSHDFEDLAEGENRILTLKDSRILDNEEDELHNIDMAEAERDKKQNDLKTKNRNYTGYDDEEFGEAGDGLKRSVLAKYDEDLIGAPENGFRLGGGMPRVRQTTRDAHEQAAAAVNKSLLSIDYTKNREISDYAEADTGFKKLKTKKKKSTRRAPADVELAAAGEGEKEDSSIQVDVPAPRERDLDANFIDDEDLQAALSRSRRQKVKRTKISPEDIAQRLAQERQAAEAQAAETNDIPMNGGAEDEGSGDVGGLTFDDTTEFVRAITYDPVVKAEPKMQPISITIKTRRSPSPDDEAVTEMDVDNAAQHNGADNDSDMENDEAVLSALAEAIGAVTNDNVAKKSEPAEDDGIGTKVETFNRGLAGTLNILRKQGIMNAPTAEGGEREMTQKDNDKWLADQRHRLAQRELQRMRAKDANKDQHQREYDNRQREQQDARESMETYKNYKPHIEINYFDEFGRVMDQKEAWKALSHRFHGKGSGKAKTEKRLKKIADERKREAMVSGDTPTSMNQAFQKRQEKVGQAHMVLSVGNRGAVPQLEEYLDNAALSKSAKGKVTKGKKKDGGDRTSVQQIDMTSFAAGNLAPGVVPAAASTEGSPAPSSFGMMKPAFSRISGGGGEFTGLTTGSGTASPAGGADHRSKVRIGFGMKRKAMDDEGLDTPPSKR